MAKPVLRLALVLMAWASTATAQNTLLLVADECANVYTDTSSSNAWASRLPRPLSLAEVFERSLDVLGAERILYGSDSSFFPRGWQKDQVQTQVGVLEELGVTKDQAAGILGGNLTRLVS